MAVPKFFISYKFFNNIISTRYLDNYSTFKNEIYSWRRLIEEANNHDKNSSYNYYLFLNNYSKIESIEKIKEFYKDDFGISNSALDIKEAMDSLTLAADLGVKAFLLIVIVGSILIIAIFSYTSYVDDKKKSAILTCLGAKNSKIASIYVVESLINGIISFVLSIILTSLIVTPINNLIFDITDVSNIISIPFNSFLGIRYLLPIIIFVCICIADSLSSLIPILFSKKISLKKELSDI